MRILIVSLILALYACNSSDASHSQNTTTVPTPAKEGFKTLDTTVSFSGYWVNEKYVDSIRITKSPVNTPIPENSCISIPNRTLKTTGMISGFHEGGEGLFVLKNGANYELWDETKENKRHDLALLPSGKLKIGNDIFVKIDYTDNPDTQPTILEELLFKGSYTNEDGTTVEFTKTGLVKGLSNFATYSAYIDYAAESTRIDIIGLGTNKSNEKDYGYRFIKDTLAIYELNCIDSESTTNNCIGFTWGKLKYKLIKQ